VAKYLRYVTLKQKRFLVAHSLSIQSVADGPHGLKFPPAPSALQAGPAVFTLAFGDISDTKRDTHRVKGLTLAA
jgi:hypothetical protein